MDRTSGQFLSRAGLADQQHVRVGCGRFADRPLQFDDRSAGTDDLVELVQSVQLPPQPLVFLEQLPILEQAAKLIVQIVEDDRFDQVVERSGLKRFHGVFDCRIGGNDQDAGGRVDLQEPPQQVDSVSVRQLHVADGDVEVVLLGKFDRLRYRSGLGDPIMLAGEKLGQCGADDVLVFDDEQ